MNIVYLGSGQFGLPSLDAVVKSSHELVLVVSQPVQPAGRGRKLTHTPAANWAVEHSIPVIETDDVNAPDIIEKIKNCALDLIVVIAFGQKIGKEVVDIAPKGAINVHGSLLPKYRGAAPFNWAIVNGETETGITIITIAERMDAGEIVASMKTPIEPQESAGELHDRLALLAGPLLLETINKIAEGTAVYKKQNESQVTRAPKLKKSDGFLDFSEPAELLYRKMLGFWPWPGTIAVYKSKKTGRTERVIFAKAEILRTTNPQNLPPGTIDENLNVICGQNRLQIVRLKPENSRLMSFADFVHGRHVCPGDEFVKIEEKGNI
ncbi:MAG: methionyl-tRNA formyltransferase [Sedimentisphaerales bacterium]|nr:methionyl-tRNA formyltransferase [Sedimentisphaerales bacterium]